jgi:hypothetical protein
VGISCGIWCPINIPRAYLAASRGNPVDGLNEHNFTARCLSDNLELDVNQAFPKGDPPLGFYDAGISISNKEGSAWFPTSEFILVFIVHDIPQGPNPPQILGTAMAKLTVISDPI